MLGLGCSVCGEVVNVEAEVEGQDQDHRVGNLMNTSKTQHNEI